MICETGGLGGDAVDLYSARIVDMAYPARASMARQN
jgi:hypothetical protein